MRAKRIQIAAIIVLLIIGVLAWSYYNSVTSVEGRPLDDWTATRQAENPLP